MFYFLEVNGRAARKYVPQVYPGGIILFRTQRPPSDVFDWCRLAAKGSETHMIAGTHLEILEEPYVDALAEHLKQYLDKAQRAERPQKP
jgi:aspartate racemase